MQINIELSPLHYIFEDLYTKGCGMPLATLVKHRIASYHILRTLLICTKLVVSLLESKPFHLLASCGVYAEQVHHTVLADIACGCGLAEDL